MTISYALSDAPDAGRARALLSERARQLAAPPRREPADTMVDVLLCRVGHDSYGLPLTAVSAIIAAAPPVPAVEPQPGLVGLHAHGGVIYGIFDLGAVLGQVAGDAASGHFIVLRHEKLRIAFRVDRAERVSPVVLENDAAGPLPAAGPVVGYARAADADDAASAAPVAVLDADRLVNACLPSSRSSGK